MNGVVCARMVNADANGWMVVHRTGTDMKPGPVVGYAPLRRGENIDVSAILQDSVAPGEMLMLMVHAEAGGMANGVFEYTLGAKDDGPIRADGKLLMTIRGGPQVSVGRQSRSCVATRMSGALSWDISIAIYAAKGIKILSGMQFT